MEDYDDERKPDGFFVRCLTFPFRLFFGLLDLIIMSLFGAISFIVIAVIVSFFWPDFRDVMMKVLDYIKHILFQLK